MMKKMIAVLLTVAMLLTCASALAAEKTYTDPDRDISFAYDDTQFELSGEDITDDELMVALNAVDAAWGMVYIQFHLRELDDGETFPTKADFAELEKGLNLEVTQGEWNGFKDVFMYTIDDESETDTVFIVPVYDADDGEVEERLTVKVGVSKLDDEEISMTRDDAISGVLDSLKILDD